MKKLSDGFASSTTRSMSHFETEVESRFRDTYSDPNKRQAPFEDKHDMNTGKAEDQKPLDDIDKEVQKEDSKIKPKDEQFPGRVKMSAVSIGKGSSGTMYYFEDGNIYDEDGEHVGKAPNAQAAKEFILKEFKNLSASDNAKFDVHSTDPARLTTSDHDKVLAKLEMKLEKRLDKNKSYLSMEYYVGNDKDGKFYFSVFSPYMMVGSAWVSDDKTYASEQLADAAAKKYIDGIKAWRAKEIEEQKKKIAEQEAKKIAEEAKKKKPKR